MDIKKVLFIVLFQGMLNFAVFAAEKHSTPSRSAFLTTQENKLLIGHVVKRFESTSQMSCSHSCLRNSWCTSTNFKVPSNKNSKGTCELNKHGSIDTSTEIHDQQGVTFSMMLKGCLMTGCLHGGSCVLDERKESFSCSCKGLWTGGNCETKIDSEVRIPLTWPFGTYGFPMAKSGCPEEGVWHPGTRFHDTEDKDPNNFWSDPYDLAGYKAKGNMEQKFCMRTQNETTKYDLPWPKGQYCVFKKGNCPEGFGEGYIQWDDEDHDNKNNVTGSLPDGVYDGNTRIQYCCRNDGYATNAINLPTDSPFVLFKGNSHECQVVNGVSVRSEFFRWDNEDDSRNKTEFKGKHPFLEYSQNNLKVHYCYYYK